MLDTQPQYQLQPVAAPTDQFSPITVKKKPFQASQDLLALGEALSGMSKDVADITARRAAAEKQWNIDEGQRFADTHAAAVKNMADFKQAVADGKLNAPDNPWFLVGLQQAIAKRQAQTGMMQIQQDLLQDPVYHQDNAQAVSDYIQSRSSGLLDGLDHWGAAAAHAELSQYHDRMLLDWSEQRRQERVDEMHSAISSQVRQRISDWNPQLALAIVHGDPEGTRRIAGMTQYVQHELDQLGKVVDWPRANAWVSEAVLQAARDARDPSLAQQILDNLKTADGASLSKTSENRTALQNLPREIEQLSLLDSRTRNEAEEQKAIREARDLYKQVPQWQEEQGKAHPFEVNIPKDVAAKSSPLAMDNLNRLLASGAATYDQIKDTKYHQELEPIQREALEAASSGKMTREQYVKFGTLMAAYGDPGRTAIEQLTRLYEYQRGIAEGTTSPEAVARLNKSLGSGSLTLNQVMDLHHAGQLDNKDLSRWSEIAIGVQSQQGRNNPILSTSQQQIEHLLAAAVADNVKLPGDSAEITNRMEQAKAAFAEQYTKLVQSKGWEDLSFAEQVKQIGEVRDAVVKAADPHAPTWEQWLKQYGTAGQATSEADRNAVRQNVFALPTTPQPTTHPGEKPAPADPMVHGVDPSLTPDLRKMLEVKPEGATVQEFVKAADRQAPAVAQVTEAEGWLHDFTAWNLTNRDLAKPDPTTGNLPVDLKGRTIGGSDAAYSAQENAIPLYGEAMNRLQSMKPDAQQALATLQTIRQKWQATGKVTAEEQVIARQEAIRYLAFLDARRQLGYTPAEVRGMGEGAWRSALMFANELDLYQRGPAVMKELGLKDVQALAFITAQNALIRDARGVAVEVPDLRTRPAYTPPKPGPWGNLLPQPGPSFLPKPEEAKPQPPAIQPHPEPKINFVPPEKLNEPGQDQQEQ